MDHNSSESQSETVLVPSQATDNSQNLSRNPADHLKPFQFQPGKSGNPGGRKKRITNAVEKYMRQKHYSGKKNIDRFAEQVVERAIAKSDMAMQEIWSRVEGPLPKEAGNSGGSANIQVVVITGEAQ